MIRMRAIPAWQAYGLALGVSLLTALVAVLVADWLGAGTWLLFVVPVALSAWVGGFGPGALATLAAVLTLSYFLSPPVANFQRLTLAEVGPMATAALVLTFLTALVARARQGAVQARAQSARSAVLAQASWAFTNAASPLHVMETLARELAGALPVGLVVQTLSDDRETLHTAAVHHPDSETLTALTELYAAPQRTAESIGGGALADGQPALLPSVSAEQLRAGLKPRYWPSLERFSGHSLLLAPLRSQGSVLGLVSVLRAPAKGSFTEDEQAFVMALTERAAAALGLAERYQAEAEQRQAAEAAAENARRLQGLAAALAAARTPDQVAAVRAEQARHYAHPSEADRGALTALTEQSARVLERLQAEHALASASAAAEKTAAWLGELQAATAALNQAVTLEQVLDQVLTHGLSLARAEAGALSLLRDGQPPLKLERSSGYTELALRALKSLRLDQPAAEAVAASTREPVWLESREACVTHFPQFAQAYASLRCEAVGVLPLLAGEQVLGTLTLAFGEARSRPSTELAGLTSYATECAQALVRAQRHVKDVRARQAAEHARDREAFLADVSDTLATTLNLPETLQYIARLALDRLADFSLVFAVGSEGAALGAAHAHRDPERDGLLGSTIRMLMTLPGQQRTMIHDMLRAGRLLHLPEITGSMLDSLPQENGLQRVAAELAPTSLLMVPLLSEGRALGVLLLCSTEASRRFDEDEQSLAQALARRAARAVDHALQHAIAQSLNVELEERVNERTEELQATIAKLEDENTERERTQAQLELSREQLRSLSARLQAAREEERARIAREVHDELGQQMAGIKMDIAWMRKKLREQQEPLLRKAKAMADQIDTTVQAVRKITQELRPGILDDFGLLAAIEWQVQEFQNRHKIETQLITELDDAQLDPEGATAVFRVFQETLTNVARHASATRVEVTLEKINNQLVLQVEDNGRGITDRELYGAASLGLLGMRERIHLLAGEIEIRGVPNEGTTVLVRVPLARTELPAPTDNGSLPAPGPRSN